MTLIIGVRCRNGIVMGSDGLTTYSSFDGLPTIELQTGSKIRVIRNNALYAAAGEVGVGQDILAKLDHKWDSISTKESRYHEVRREIATAISGEIEQYANRIEKTLIVVNRDKIPADRYLIEKVEFQSVICTSIGNECYLFQFDEHGNPVELEPAFTFIAIGSGQEPADFFLKFIKRVVWENRPPETIRQAITGVLWTLQYVTSGSASLGVGDPFSIGVLEKENDTWQTSTFEGDSLRLYEDDIRIAEKALRENLNAQIESSTPPVRED